MIAPGPGRRCRLQEQQDHHQYNEHPRQRRSEGPVAGRQELVVDQVPNHLQLAAAQQVRCYEIADRQHEDENGARRYAMITTDPDTNDRLLHLVKKQPPTG